MELGDDERPVYFGNNRQQDLNPVVTHYMSMFKSRGQTLVLFLGFVAAMTGMLLVVFNSGQVTNAKMRAMNAADAAAYSGAVWQARNLNFQAYMNRAMVVNEVTIAQSVSMRSWLSYVNRFVTNVNYITQFIPYVGNATTSIQRVIEKTNDTVQKMLPVFDRGLRITNALEHKAQDGFHLAGILIARDLAINVARENGAVMAPSGDALMGLNAVRWEKFTAGYDNDRRTRIRNVTLDSRDGFSQSRDHYFREPTGVVFEIRKQGGTDLVDYDTWKGLDSSQLRELKIGGKWTGKTEMAWGGAQDYIQRRQTRIGTHGDINEWNDNDGRRARTDANRNNQKQIGIGFQGYRDIADPDVKQADLQLPFSVEVLIEKQKLATANSAFDAKSVLIDGTRLEHDPHYADDRGVYAMGHGCVRFARPYRQDRADGGREYPSLFNPYWTASLATEGEVARAMADGFKKLPLPITTFFGTNNCS